MHSAVATLKSVLIPSPLPTPMPPPWVDIERAIGVKLPQDYRNFIEVYGKGRINDALSVYYPARRRADSRVILTVLRDETFDDFSVGEFVEGQGFGIELRAFPEPGGLLQWGGTDSGDMFFWFTESDDPNQWPVIAFHRYDCTFHRYGGGMAEFLIEVVTRAYEHWRPLIGERPGGARWIMFSDWGTKYGMPPHASFDWSDDGVRFGSGSLMPLCESSNTGGGDQDIFGRTGEVVPLISLGDDGTSVWLSGGGLSPGMAYHLFAWLRVGPDVEAIGLELLCGGTPLAVESVAADTSGASKIEAQILVPAHAPAVPVQLRILGDLADLVASGQGFYMWVKGTLGD